MESSGELTERQQYWLDHLQGCEELGETTKAYAELHGLSVSMMYSWRKELTIRGVYSRQSSGFCSPRFDRVQVIESKIPTGTWRITLQNGVQIEFSGVVDGTTQAKLLETLVRL